MLDPASPDLDGWQICKTIRGISKLPILLISAINTPGIVTQALDQGADDYLVKPVPSNVLIAHLNKLTRRARAEIQASAFKTN